jgi:hypothetical protein
MALPLYSAIEVAGKRHASIDSATLRRSRPPIKPNGQVPSVMLRKGAGDEQQSLPSANEIGHTKIRRILIYQRPLNSPFKLS